MFNTFTKSFSQKEALKNKEVNIMICFDDKDGRTTELIKNLGVNSVSYFESLEKLKEHIFNLKKTDKNDIIIIDIKLLYSQEQNEEFCKLLKKEGVVCSIIAVTELNTKSESLQSFMNDGINDVLFKPFTKTEIIKTLNNCNN